MKRHFFSVSILFAFAIIAHAGEKVPLSKELAQCIGKSGGSDFAMIECNGTEYTKQDRRLNDAYRKLLARVSKPKAEELRKVQRAWIAYVEAHCKFLYDNDELAGTLDRLAASNCSVTERATRATDLESLLVQLGEK